MKFHILYKGCNRRRMDSQRTAQFLKVNGHALTDDIGDADYVLFDTCSFKEELDAQNIETIEKEIKPKMQSGAQLVVCGCMPAISTKLLRGYHMGSTYTPRTQKKLEEIIHAKFALSDVPMPTFEGTPSKHFDPQAKAFKNFEANVCRIRIAEGCLGSCSYCGIKKATGSLESTPIPNIVNQFKAGLSAGYYKFCLDAEDTAAYGLEAGHSLAELIGEILKTKDNFILGLYDLNPRWVEKNYERLWPLFEDHRIRELVFPYQSGSPRILSLMNRGYDVGVFEHRMRELRAMRPDLILGTSIIVGFPSETSEDFERTLQVLKLFNWTHVHMYSDREGTPSSKLEGKVLQEAKEQRALMAKMQIDGENFEGFHELEPGGYRWARRKSHFDLLARSRHNPAKFTVVVKPVIGYAGGQTLSVHYQLFELNNHATSMAAPAYAGGHVFHDAPPDQDVELTFNLPNIDEGTICRVHLATDKWTVPAAHGGKDTRELGLYIRSIQLR